MNCACGEPATCWVGPSMSGHADGTLMCLACFTKLQPEPELIDMSEFEAEFVTEKETP